MTEDGKNWTQQNAMFSSTLSNVIYQVGFLAPVSYPMHL